MTQQLIFSMLVSLAMSILVLAFSGEIKRAMCGSEKRRVKAIVREMAEEGELVIEDD